MFPYCSISLLGSLALEPLRPTPCLPPLRGRTVCFQRGDAGERCCEFLFALPEALLQVYLLPGRACDDEPVLCSPCHPCCAPLPASASARVATSSSGLGTDAGARSRRGCVLELSKLRMARNATLVRTSPEDARTQSLPRRNPRRNDGAARP